MEIIKAKTSNLILILSLLLITLSSTSCKKSLPPIGDIELGISKEEALKQLEKAGTVGTESENYPNWLDSWGINILGVKWHNNEYRFNDKDELIGVYCWSSDYMSQSDIKVLHAKMEELCGDGTITTDDGEEFNVRYGIYDDKPYKGELNIRNNKNGNPSIFILICLPDDYYTQFPKKRG